VAQVGFVAVNPPNPNVMWRRDYDLMKPGRVDVDATRVLVEALLTIHPGTTIEKMTELLDYLVNHQDLSEYLRQA